MSRMGVFEDFQGDSSEIIVDQAMDFIRQQAAADKPFFTVIWYGTPHSPFIAVDADKQDFGKLDRSSADHYGELVAMDRSLGTLRKELRDLNIADSTLLWFCSDNGGLPKIKPGTVGGLKGFKNSVYEGGLRVPAVIEWPNGISKPRITNYPACTMDIFPTLAAVAALSKTSATVPLDGLSLKPLFAAELPRRDKPIGFRHTNRTAFLDNRYKLINFKVGSDRFELYDLESDPFESNNIIDQQPQIASRLKSAWAKWNDSIEASIAGQDYPEGKVIPPDPGPATWTELDAYRPLSKRVEEASGNTVPGSNDHVSHVRRRTFIAVHPEKNSPGVPSPWRMVIVVRMHHLVTLDTDVILRFV